MTDYGGAMGTGFNEDITKATIAAELNDSPTGSHDPSASIEKGELSDWRERHASIASIELTNNDPFPEDPDGEPELQQFTFRAVFVGCVLGGVIAASKYGPIETYCVVLSANWFKRLSWFEDRLDVRSLSLRFDLRICHFKTPISSSSQKLRGWLFWSKGERVLPICCNSGGKLGSSLHEWFPGCLSAGSFR